jgi:hypothetical protein
VLFKRILSFVASLWNRIGGGGDVEDSMAFGSRLQERENIENITIAILVHKRET